MYQLDDDIPVPPGSGGSGRGRRRLYPLGEMMPGQSFVVPKLRASAARQSVEKWAHRHPGWEYATRWEGDSLRIWRVA